MEQEELKTIDASIESLTVIRRIANTSENHAYMLIVRSAQSSRASIASLQTCSSFFLEHPESRSLFPPFSFHTYLTRCGCVYLCVNMYLCVSPIGNSLKCSGIIPARCLFLYHTPRRPILAVSS